MNENLAEGLWAELGDQGVDVCCTPLGSVWTRPSSAWVLRSTRHRVTAGGRA
jgi:hypothetical protein